MALYAIGDVQGCFDELQQLLATISFNPDTDRLWFCGDLVNRGPRSLETLEFIHSIRDNIVTVLGNHDLHLLATFYHHKKPGRKDTLVATLESDRAAPLMEWLRRRPLLHHDDTLGLCLVHAGLHPDWSIPKAKVLAAEVEAVLRGEQHVDFYRHMYGDKPATWSEDLSGWARLRFITNVLTRIRYLDAKHRVQLKAKGAPGTQPADSTPWFDLPQRKSAGDRVLFGHWSTLSLVERDFHNVYPLDTGCLWGGRLTALRIDGDDFRWHHVECDQQSAPGDDTD